MCFSTKKRVFNSAYAEFASIKIFSCCNKSVNSAYAELYLLKSTTANSAYFKICRIKSGAELKFNSAQCRIKTTFPYNTFRKKVKTAPAELTLKRRRGDTVIWRSRNLQTKLFKFLNPCLWS